MTCSRFITFSRMGFVARSGFLVAGTPARAGYTTWDAPSSVNSGQSYPFTVQAYGYMYGADITVYKNGNYFSGGYNYDSETTSDTGPQTVHYLVATYDSYYDTTDYAEYTVTVNGTAPPPPTCTVSASAGTITTGQQVVISVNGSDVDGNLHYLNVDQISPTNGYYGPGDTGNEWPPNNGAYDLGGYFSNRTRNLTLTLGTPGTYTFRGAANDDSGWVYSSNTVTVTVGSAPDTSPPSTPSNVEATGVGPTSFTLIWSPSSDNVGVTDYEVYGNGQYWGSTGGATSKAISGLAPSTAYSIQVRARDAAGNWSGFATTPATTASEGGALASTAWVDINGDGIRDEVISVNGPTSGLYINSVNTVCWDYAGYEVNSAFQRWPYHFPDVNPEFESRRWDPVVFWRYFSSYSVCATYVEPVIEFQTDAGYEYQLYQDPSESASYNPANWQQIFASSEFGTANPVYSLGLNPADFLYQRQYFLVRIGKPLGGVQLTNSLGQILVGNVTEGTTANLNLPIGAGLTLDAKDFLGGLLPGNQQVRWRVVDGDTGVTIIPQADGNRLTLGSDVTARPLLTIFFWLFGYGAEKQVTVKPRPTVGLALSSNGVTLMDTVTMAASVSPTDPNNPPTYTFEMKRDGTSTWYPLSSGPQTTLDWVVRVAGTFQVRSKALIESAEVTSGEQILVVSFPSASDILNAPGVRARMDQAWTDTKNATTTTTRREEGYYIQINTSTGTYGIIAHSVETPPVSNSQGASWNTAAYPRPADSYANPTPFDEPIYTIAWFHTHTPTTYRTDGRGVGPSTPDRNWSTDSNINIPGFVYDYVESPSGSGQIPAGHPINSPAQVYPITPPSNRPVP